MAKKPVKKSKPKAATRPSKPVATTSKKAKKLAAKTAAAKTGKPAAKSTSTPAITAAKPAAKPIAPPRPVTRHPGVPDWGFGPFTRPPNAKPVIEPRAESVFDCPMRERPIHWEGLHAFNPAAAVKDGKVHVLYRTEDDTGAMRIGAHTSRLGLAVSDDGVNFTRRPAPVFFPANDGQKGNEWEGGCEDPRCVETEDGGYLLTYTQWNQKVARLAVATSRNLVDWAKHGPAFAGIYRDAWSKSGAIVCRVEDGRMIATRINGRYWMYWGEGAVYLAHSNDLKRWTPVVDAEGMPLSLLAPRPKHFDSGLAEGGPPAVLTARGIVVLYNGKNGDGELADPTIKPGVYAGGQALFDAADPSRLLARTDQPFFKPECEWEATGQYKAGTTFIEGLVLLRGQWLLYYGCADSRVGVAMAKAPAIL